MSTKVQEVHFLAEMTKPFISNFGENHFFFVSSKSHLALQKFCMSICRVVLLTEPCNFMTCILVLTAMNVFILSYTFYFFEIQGFVISAMICLFVS